MANEAFVSAKSSGVCGSASPREEKGKGGVELQLTPETDSWSGMERHEAWANLGQLGVLPACRVEKGGVGAVEARVPVHMVDGVADACAAGYEDWGLTIGPAALGEHGGFGGDADVDWELWV